MMAAEGSQSFDTFGLIAPSDLAVTVHGREAKGTKVENARMAIYSCF
jgi:hypothetical protein